MDKMITVMVGAMIILVLGITLLTLTDSRLNLIGEQATTSSTEVGCQDYRQEYIDGEIDESDVHDRCEVDSSLRRKKTVAEALKGLG